MAPRAKAKSKAKEVAQSSGAVPPAVLEAYSAYRSKQDDASLEGLVQLVEGGTGGSAACLALCKASLSHAALVACERRDEAGEEEAGRLVQQALEAAVHGALRHKSAQLLTAAMRILLATCGGAAQLNRRAAAAGVLLRGCSAVEVSTAVDRGVDPRVLPVAAMRGEAGVPRDIPLKPPRDKTKGWWSEVPADSWADPEAERVGADRWPWEHRGGRAGFHMYVADALVLAGQLQDLEMAEQLRVANVAIMRVSQERLDSVNGALAYGMDKVRSQQRQMKEGLETPTSERLAASVDLLPPDRQRRLAGLRKQRGGGGGGQQDAAGGKDKARNAKLQVKLEALMARKQQEEEEARVRDAVERARVFKSHLRLRLPAGATAVDVGEALLQEARLPLAAALGHLRRLAKEGRLPEREAADLMEQLHWLANMPEAAAPPVCYRLPASMCGDSPEFAPVDAQQFEATLERELLVQPMGDEYADLLRASDGALQRVLQAAEGVVGDANDALARLAGLLALRPDMAADACIDAVPHEEWERCVERGELCGLPFLHTDSLGIPNELPCPLLLDEDLEDVVGICLPPFLDNNDDASTASLCSGQEGFQDADEELEAGAAQRTSSVGSGYHSGPEEALNDDSDLEEGTPFVPHADAPGTGQQEVGSRPASPPLCGPSRAEAAERPAMAAAAVPGGGADASARQQHQLEERARQRLEERRELDEDVARLSEVLRAHAYARTQVAELYSAKLYLPPDRQGAVPLQYSKAPAMKMTYQLADLCLRPAVLGNLLMGFLVVDAAPHDQAGSPPQAPDPAATLHINPEQLLRLEEASLSREPLGALLVLAGHGGKAQVEDALRTLCSDLLRRESDVLLEAAKEKDVGKQTAALGKLRDRLQLDLCADFFRRLDLLPRVDECLRTGNIEAAGQCIEGRKGDLVAGLVLGLRMLHSTYRLTKQQFAAVDQFLTECSFTREEYEAAKSEFDARSAALYAEWDRVERSPEQVLEDVVQRHHSEAYPQMTPEDRANMLRNYITGDEWADHKACIRGEWEAKLERLKADAKAKQREVMDQRLCRLPLDALERLHAFVCVLVADSVGSPAQLSLEITADVMRMKSVGRVARRLGSQGGPSGAGGGDGERDALELLELGIREEGVAQALNHLPAQPSDDPLDAALTSAAYFATSLVPVPSGGGSGQLAGGEDSAPAAAQQQQQEPGGSKLAGKASRRQGGARGAGGAAAAAPAAESSAGSGLGVGGDTAGLLLLPTRHADRAGTISHLAWTCRQFMVLVRAFGWLSHMVEGVDRVMRYLSWSLRHVDTAVVEQACSRAMGTAEAVAMAKDVAEAQKAAMFQAQRAFHVAEALHRRCRVQSHAADEQRAKEALAALQQHGQAPAWWGYQGLARGEQEQEMQRVADAARRRAQEVGDEAADALRKTTTIPDNWLNNVAYEWRMSIDLERIERLTNMARNLSAKASGSGGPGDLGGVDFELDELELLGLEDLDSAALISRLGPSSHARRDEASRAMQTVRAGAVALKGLWHNEGFQSLLRSVTQEVAEANAFQAEMYRAARLLAGALCEELGCVECPADGLARCMLAHMLPAEWQEGVERAEAANRESAWHELTAHDGTTEAAAGMKKKKKKKGKKGGGGTAGAADAAAAAAQPSGEDQEAAGEGEGEGDDDPLALLELVRPQRQGARNVPAAAQQPAVEAAGPDASRLAEQEEAYRRLVREYEAVQAQERQQAVQQARHAQQEQQAQQAPRSGRASAVSQAASDETLDAAGDAIRGSTNVGNGGAAGAAEPAAEAAHNTHSLEALLAASAAFDWSAIEGGDAERGWQGSAEPASRAGWQEASAAGHRHQQAAGKAAPDSKPAAAAAEQQQARPQQQQQEQRRVDPSKPRVVGWDGAWLCKCAKRHSLTEGCKACGAPALCRDFLKSGCPFKGSCRFTHPQFALEPAEAPPPGMHLRDVVVTSKLPKPSWKTDEGGNWRVRVVSWRGDWVCPCDRKHHMQDDCRSCGHPAPCRDWLRGTCRRSDCLYPHPPFDLPAGSLPPADVRVVNKRDNMPQWRQQRAPSAAGAAPLRRLVPVPPTVVPEPPSAQAVLAKAGPAVVQALASQLGMSAGELEGLPADALADMIEQLSVQLVEAEQQQQDQRGAADAAVAGGSAVLPSLLPVVPGAAPAKAAQVAVGSGGSELRILGSDGTWMCICGKQQGGKKTKCTVPGCKQEAPCWKWMLGTCTSSPCQFPHPPFDESGSWAPPKGGLTRAVLWEGAPRYRPAPSQQEQQQEQQQQEQPSSWSQAPPAGSAAVSHGTPLPLLPHAVPDAPVGWEINGSGDVAPPAAAHLPAGLLDDDAAEVDELLQLMGVSGFDKQQPGGGGDWVAGPAAQAAQAPGASALSSLATPGLQNEAGEYNCFLNVIIQCLWRCTRFRDQITSWGPDLYQGDPVVSALHSLFAAFAAEERMRRLGGPLTGTAARRPVNPSDLRHALSALPGQQFRVGEMNDAGEVLLTIYERTMAVSAHANAIVNTIFGLSVQEQVQCTQCGKTTHQTAYTQYFYNAQAAALQHASQSGQPCRMGELFRHLESLHLKSCDVDVGGCDAKNCVRYTLDRLPHVFTLQLAWRSVREEPGAIAATLRTIDEQVDLAEFYGGIRAGTVGYQLRSMVCYYGAHYSAFVWADDLNAWLMFDDANVSCVGSWADVRQKCKAGRIQPSVLFYEAPTTSLR